MLHLVYQSNIYAISVVDLVDTLSRAVTAARIRHSKSIIIIVVVMIITIITRNMTFNMMVLLLMIETMIIE